MNNIYTAGFDGSAIPNPGEMKIGGWVKDPNGKVIYQFTIPMGQGTNNEAEYHAFIKLLRVVNSLDIKNISITGDSALVVNQINKKWKVKNERIKTLWIIATSLLEGINWSLKHVVRKYNSEADLLSR